MSKVGRLLVWSAVAWLGNGAAQGATLELGLSAAPEPGLRDSVVRAISPRVRAIDAERHRLKNKLSRLPVPAAAATSGRLGWRSRIVKSAIERSWVQVDLGAVFPVDSVVLVPVRGATVESGYGFPVRFRVESSAQTDFQADETIADESLADVPNPGAFPVLVRAGGGPARYVRVTWTKHWERADDWLGALGELMVISGQRKVASGRPVKSSSNTRSLPAWDRSNLTDGQSGLGAPVGTEPSSSNGYLAQHETFSSGEKWVQVDQKKSVPIQEVRLFPARPPGFTRASGHGFPVRFRVETADESSFRERRILFNTGSEDYPNPGDFPVMLSADGGSARYVRVTATRLYDKMAHPLFALAELQVWSGVTNVARGAEVAAFDVASANEARWSKEALVDGYNSHGVILGYPEWLAGLDEARKIVAQISLLDAERPRVATAAIVLAERLTAGGVVLIAAGLAAMGVRTRRARRHAVEDMRQQIARDLHDEIGSNLGSIALLSEAAREQTGDESTRKDFAEISRVAGLTNYALGEIVWLLDTRMVTREELVARLRENAPTLLGETPHRFEVPDQWAGGLCRPEFTRNVWLIFKETLHNIAKHSAATDVQVCISEPDGGFALAVADNGRGFHEKSVTLGRGLANLRRRAEELGGGLHLASETGRGTRVTLIVPKS